MCNLAVASKMRSTYPMTTKSSYISISFYDLYEESSLKLNQIFKWKSKSLKYSTKNKAIILSHLKCHLSIDAVDFCMCYGYISNQKEFNKQYFFLFCSNKIYIGMFDCMRQTIGSYKMVTKCFLRSSFNNSLKFFQSFQDF